ncbi:MAG: FAD-linked oxidase C-terminal domain-containing protein [Thermodesulfobacteriota bacterium]
MHGLFIRRGRKILNPAILKRLAAIVGTENLTASPEECLCYAYDGTGREFPPAAVVFPASTDEVGAIMRLASEHRLPVVPRGAGTGMSGGALAVQGGIVLAMSRMNRIVEIDTANQLAVVEPGVITADLQAEANRHGLAYPPDPASSKFCTVGGNVAECAGGPSAVKYGVTRDYVLGLTAVLPSGEIIHTGVRTAKGVVGYDLTRLLVGSEGTLAIITRITLRLVPKPPARATLLLLCAGMEVAATLVARILQRHTPAMLEYLDATAIGIIRPLLPFALPPEARALLLLELDGSAAAVAAEQASLKEFLASQAGVLQLRAAADPAEAEQLWQARRAISPAAFNLRPHKLSEDVVVPKSRIPELVACSEQLAREYRLPIFTFGHAGDGNIHVNIMLDRANPAERQGAEAAKAELFKEVLRLNGTLSGEHGVGITKAPFIGLEIDAPTLTLMRAVKHAFDPAGILNPGKIFPPAEAGTPEKH